MVHGPGVWCVVLPVGIVLAMARGWVGAETGRDFAQRR